MWIYQCVGPSRFLAACLALASLAAAPVAGPPGARGEPPAAGPSDDFRVRVSAALVLGTSADPAAREPLERTLTGDPHVTVRVAAAAALAALSDPAARGALELAARGDAEGDVRAAAAASLSRLERARSLPRLRVRVGRADDATPAPRLGRSAALLEVVRATLSRLPVDVLDDDTDVVSGVGANGGAIVVDATLRGLTVERSQQQTAAAASVEIAVSRDGVRCGALHGTGVAVHDALEHGAGADDLGRAALSRAVSSAIASSEALAAAIATGPCRDRATAARGARQR